MRERGEHSELNESGEVQRGFLVSVFSSDLLLPITIGTLIILTAIAIITTPQTPSSLRGEDDANKKQVCAEQQQDTYVNWWFGIRHSSSCSLGDVEGTPIGGKGNQSATKAQKSQGDPLGLTITQADLLAQEKVAHWTRWIGVFTAVGLGALIWTLMLTRQANLSAQESVRVTRTVGEQSTRAYVAIAIDGLKVGGKANQNNPVEVAIELRLRLTNYGASPAYDAVVHNQLDFVGWPDTRAFSQIAITNSDDIGILMPGESNEIRLGFKLTYDPNLGINDQHRFVLCGKLLYRDAFNKHRFTKLRGSIENFHQLWLAESNASGIDVGFHRSNQDNDGN